MMRRTASLASAEKPSTRFGDLADDLRQRVCRSSISRDACAARVCFSISGSFAHHLGALAGVAHVAGDGRREHRAEILRGVGQRGVRADRDALHALRAVLGDVERRLAAGDVLGGRVAGARGHDAHGGERRCRLVVAEAGAEFGVELRRWLRSAYARLVPREAVWNGSRQCCSRRCRQWPSRGSGSSGCPRRRGLVGRGHFADLDFLARARSPGS